MKNFTYKKFIITNFFALTFIFLTQFCLALDITVTKYNDTLDGNCDGDCSLREAVELANTTPGKDRILLNSGTYILDIPSASRQEIVYEDEWWYEVIHVLVDEDNNQNSDLDITDDLVIEGYFDGTTIIDGKRDGRLFEILSGDVSLKKLTLVNGYQSNGPDAKGGAIENHSTLTLHYCTLTENSVRVGDGGAIYNRGTVNIYSSDIFDNGLSHHSESYSFVARLNGTAIFNRGTLVIRDSSVRANGYSTYIPAVAPTIYNIGTVDIRRSLFTENNVGASAGVIHNVGGNVKIVSSTFSHNIGATSDEDSAEKGSGVIVTYNNILGEGKLSLTNVTIVDHALYGLNLIGDAYIRNSIIAGNARAEDGLSTNCYRSSGLLEVHNVIIGNGENPNCTPSNTDSGRHFIPVDNNRVFVSLLDALADNGGPTQTHALRRTATNIAIDRITDGSCPSTDQRGQFTGVEGNNNNNPGCDLGAYELQP